MIRTVRFIISSLLVVTVGIVHHSSARSLQADSCGYETCNPGKPGMLNIHLVPHTHDDVGWLKTVDQYYYGARSNIQKAGVQYIIDSVVDELEADPERKFIYVEMAFFMAWWKEQKAEKQDVVRELVANGRLEFINGGWCMNDEATTHYVDIIDQMSLGLNLLNETFGECGRPRVSWQIDPFGHSREQAAIFAQMGYDGLFFGRLDHQDKDLRQATQTMEMVWKASNTLGEAGSLFTGVNYNLYQAPDGFCWDILCDDEPIIDSKKSKDYNVDKRVTDFLNYCENQAKSYGTDHIMMTMGGDFTYQDANVWFKNMDKLIKYANERQSQGSKFNLFYSTPSCYVKALNDADRKWSTKTNDFFPYSSDDHSYWTGYFTSRPAIKYMVRQASNLLQSCKQMATGLSLSGTNNEGNVDELKEAMGIMQHHDAVSGTEKQTVANDYARLLHKGIVECQKTAAVHYQKELALGSKQLSEVTHCQLNISQCEVSEKNEKFVVNVYNSLTRSINKYVRVPVKDGNYEVLDGAGKPIETQLVPIADYVASLPERKSSATHELVFLAEDLPPIGSKSYHVEATKTKNRRMYKSKARRIHPGTKATIGNGAIKVNVDNTTGLIGSVEVNGKVTKLKQEFLWYAGMNGDNTQSEKRASGAYIFRPNGTAFPISSKISTTITEGSLVSEIHQVYDGSWIGQTIRVYKGQEHVELDWVVGPIPVKDTIGKEIISRVSTELETSAEVYTDANGRQTLKRVKDHRDTWTYKITEPVAGNYYPINSHIYVKDDQENQVTLLVDRSQGGASLEDGQLELMVHRRLLHDDAFGVGEPINEPGFDKILPKGLVVRGTHYLIVSDKSNSAKLCRSLGQELYKQPQISFMTTDLDFTQWKKNFKTKVQGIAKALPESVNLLTMEPRADGAVLVRLEHIYDIGEDEELSRPVTVSLDDLFPGYTIVSAKETMLGGNQFKADSERLSWTTVADEEKNSSVSKKRKFFHPKYTKAIQAGPSVTLGPMDIKTYLLTLSPKQ